MTLLQQRKWFVFRINVHFPRNGRHFEFWLHFGSYINFYKSETFLLPHKTFIDIFICVTQEIVLCRWLKKISQSNRGHLGISRHCCHKTKNQR